MLKKIFLAGIIFISLINFSFAVAPEVNCDGLPGCSSIQNASEDVGLELVTNLIGQVIQLVAGIAVISLILSGILYLLSGGEEDKVKKAKSWIIWSLVGVITSVSAWGIISVLNNISIN